MKKTIVMAVLGVAASVASSYGQGFVNFTTYSANNGTGVAVYEGVSGSTQIIPDGFKFDVYYALGTAVTDPVNTALGSSITSAPSGLTDYGLVGVTSSGGNSEPDPTTLTLNTYVSGAVTFEVVAFNGSSYADSTIRGRSGSFTMPALATGSAPVTNIGDTALGSGAGTFPTMYVTSVPEPTTLALAGLGGLASLVALRRKQA
jgi:hypothetical protein